MAVLLSLKQKDKNFIFTSFDNDKSDNPAKIIFSRFPLADEIFPAAQTKNVLDSKIMKTFDNSPKSKQLLVEHIINSLIENISASRIDYKKFLHECVDSFINLEYEGKEIKTVNEFLSLPEEAVFIISQEAYLYAKQNDEFSMVANKKK